MSLDLEAIVRGVREKPVITANGIYELQPGFTEPTVLDLAIARAAARAALQPEEGCPDCTLAPWWDITDEPLRPGVCRRHAAERLRSLTP